MVSPGPLTRRRIRHDARDANVKHVDGSSSIAGAVEVSYSPRERELYVRWALPPVGREHAPGAACWRPSGTD